MSRQFSVTFDYRSPFAYVLLDDIFQALEAGAGWDVTFSPYVLAQAHLEPGLVPVWGRKEPHDSPGFRALQVAVTVRDTEPDRFEQLSRSFFEARFKHARDISDPSTVVDVIKGALLDPDKILQVGRMEQATETIRREHENNESRGVFGVPCLVVDEQVGFVRLLRHAANGAAAQQEVERLLDLLTWPNLDEFKRPAFKRPPYRGEVAG